MQRTETLDARRSSSTMDSARPGLQRVPSGEAFFKIEIKCFFGYFDPENIFVDNENK